MTTPKDDGRIVSDFAEDPEMTELVDFFVSHLPERISALESAVGTRDVEAMSALTHQLKGAAPGYGFDSIGQAAGVAEQAIRGGEPGAIDHVNTLIGLCRKVSGRAA